jgi:hypothetical protein
MFVSSSCSTSALHVQRMLEGHQSTLVTLVPDNGSTEGDRAVVWSPDPHSIHCCALHKAFTERSVYMITCQWFSISSAH